MDVTLLFLIRSSEIMAPENLTDKNIRYLKKIPTNFSLYPLVC